MRKLRLPAGGNLWRTWKYAPWHEQSSNGGQLISLRVGTSSDNGDDNNWGSPDSWNKGFQNFEYDSFGNVMTLEEGYNNGSLMSASFGYDAHNRLTSGHGLSYSYDDSGRLTSYEGATQSFATPKDAANPHAVKWSKLGQGSATNRNVVVRGAGSKGCGNVWPILEMFVNGVKRGSSVSVNSTTWQGYPFTLPLTGRDQIDIVFDNDCTTTGDRNPVVDYIDVATATGTTRVQAEGPTILDYGNGNAKFDGVNLTSGGQGLYSNAALRFVVAPDSSSASYGYDANCLP